MTDETSPYLTVRELARLLRVKERKVYALAADGEVPCSRATGKLLFPRDGVERWLARHSSGGEAPAGARPAAVFAGSHDPLLEWALSESRAGIATFFDGSLDGLARLGRSEAFAAGLHLFDPVTDDWNRGAVAAALGGRAVVLFQWAWRERGLIVPPGNPKGLQRLADLSGLRVMPRQAEAGSQVLFEALLARQGIAAEAFQVADSPARGEVEVALAVADGKADAAFGLACAARQFRLEFIPLVAERFDIAVYRRDYFEPPFQTMLVFCRGPAFAAKARELGGYDLSGFGRIHYNAP